MKLEYLLLSLVLLLSSCGGGGGSNSGKVSEDNSVNLSGIAATGIIKNAKVSAYLFENNIKGSLIDSTITNNNGEYNLQLKTNKKTTILIELVGITGRSAIICDNSLGCSYNNIKYNFGVEYPIDSNFKLTSIVDSQPNTEYQTNITPLTDILVNLVMSGQSIAQANNKIIKYFKLDDSIDLIKLKPINITENINDISDIDLEGLLIISSFEDKNIDIKTKISNTINAINKNLDYDKNINDFIIPSIATAKIIKDKNNHLNGEVNNLINKMKESIINIDSPIEFPKNIQLPQI
jgi:hypothetical protein